MIKVMTDHERSSLVDALHAEARSDLVGLWEIAKEVEAILGTGEVAREQSLIVVRDLLERGLVAGDPPYGPGGYKVWGEQSPDVVVGRIRAAWISLGRTPNIPDIAWFAAPE